MSIYFDILYVIVFLTMIVISTKVLLASHLDKCFKQGKIIEIRFAYVIVSVIISYIVTKAVVEITEATFHILTK